LNKLPTEANNTLSFETKDQEIQDFVRKLKKRRFVKKMCFYAAIAILLVVFGRRTK